MIPAVKLLSSLCVCVYLCVCVCVADCLVCLRPHCVVKDLTQRSRSCCCNTNTTFHHFVSPAQDNPAGRASEEES